MKSKRLFLESMKHSDSYIRASIDDDTGELDLKLSDCDRRICWYFGKPGNKRAIRKMKVVKSIIDEAYEHLTKKPGGAA